ncbi:hypothetical protein ABZX95_32425 [Streptomyces sp. NPDC004232]|uniref:hypothetical protein n=1 Tax=Streptomyces sp. NPDC004232 TaxID=3154454 RepID=UPI0033BF11B2
MTSSDDYSSPTGAPGGDPLAAQVRPEFVAGEVDDALSAAGVDGVGFAEGPDGLASPNSLCTLTPEPPLHRAT